MTVKRENMADTLTANGLGKTSNGNGKVNSGSQVALCASCDRCRARKTKCDGKRPCGNCAAKYLKKHKLTSIEGIDLSLFECIYSPAKRRGPVPGKAGQARRANEALETSQNRSSGSSGNNGMGLVSGMGGLSTMGIGTMENSNLLSINGLNIGGAQGILSAAGESALTAEMLQNHLENQSQNQMSSFSNSSQHSGNNSQQIQVNQMDMNDSMSIQRQMLLQQQLAMQGLGFDKNQGYNSSIGNNLIEQGVNFNAQGLVGGMSSQQTVAQQLNLLQQLQAQQQQQQQQQQQTDIPGQMSNYQHHSQRNVKNKFSSNNNVDNMIGLSKSFTKHVSLLKNDSKEGNLLRAYYQTSIDDLFDLPHIPSDEEYCNLIGGSFKTNMLPRFDHAALNAARFSEIALGALVNNQIPLALELSNATVLCLRECVDEPIHHSCVFDIARAYFLHALFRSYRGDVERYLKYRRVCLKHISQLEGSLSAFKLIAAISFHDSWTYIVHNAEDDTLPEINDIPSVGGSAEESNPSHFDKKYELACKPSDIVCSRMNQSWIQGAPPVFINNDAPTLSRVLDALSCAIRSCCDQANERFRMMAKGFGADDGNDGHMYTPTTGAVMRNQNELCSRNLVMSAFTLLQQYESSSSSTSLNRTLHTIISAMDAFLEGGDEEEDAGFTDSQIQSLLSVCNTIIEHPRLLYSGGPVYHMISNATSLLCHLLNAMHSRLSLDSQAGDLEVALFDEVLDTFTCIRKILMNHRKKLPTKLACHWIPRPNNSQPGTDSRKGVPFIDLGETLMCSSRGCQGFILMGCSPCVAAERAQVSEKRRSDEMKKEDTLADGKANDFGKELHDLGLEFDMDDDALLNVLSRIIST